MLDSPPLARPRPEPRRPVRAGRPPPGGGRAVPTARGRSDRRGTQRSPVAMGTDGNATIVQPLRERIEQSTRLLRRATRGVSCSCHGCASPPRGNSCSSGRNEISRRPPLSRAPVTSQRRSDTRQRQTRRRPDDGDHEVVTDPRQVERVAVHQRQRQGQTVAASALDDCSGGSATRARQAGSSLAVDRLAEVAQRLGCPPVRPTRSGGDRIGSGSNESATSASSSCCASAHPCRQGSSLALEDPVGDHGVDAVAVERPAASGRAGPPPRRRTPG